MIEKYTTEASFILERKRRHRLQMVHSEFKLMFALSNDKDQRKKSPLGSLSLSVNESLSDSILQTVLNCTDLTA